MRGQQVLPPEAEDRQAVSRLASRLALAPATVEPTHEEARARPGAAWSTGTAHRGHDLKAARTPLSV